jgi:predicted component of type VI protein secretion system
MKFWGISPSIPQMLMTPLIELLPHAHKIAGNLAITTQCLENILQEKVSSQKVSAPVTQVETDYIYELGTGQLGMGMVIGEQFKEDFPLVEFTIGPLCNSQIHDYLEGGKREEFLKTFYNFFLPVEADVITRVKVAEGKQYMILKTEEEPVLGYSSVLF